MINTGLNWTLLQFKENFSPVADSIKIWIFSVKSKELISILKIYFPPAGYPNIGALLKFIESLEKENKLACLWWLSQLQSRFEHIWMLVQNFAFFSDMCVDLDLFNVSTGNLM